MPQALQGLEVGGLNLLPVGAMVIDADLRIAEWNRTLEEWTAIRRDEAVGVCLTELFEVLAGGLYEKRLRELFVSGLPVLFSASLHRHFLPIPPRDGLPLLRMIQRTEARLLPGRRDHAVIWVQDVTMQYHHLAQLKEEREQLVATQSRMQVANQRLELANRQLQRAEKTLRESREYTDGILRSMVDMLVVFTPDGVITRVNQAARTNLGTDETDLCGRPVEVIFADAPEDSRQAITASDFAASLIDRLELDGSVSELEGWRLDRDGREKPVSLSGAVMRDAQGKPIGYVCVLQDTAERKRIQAELARGKRLQSVGQLAAGIAHEINTPLQCISNGIEYLDMQSQTVIDALDRMSVGDDPEEQRRVATARREVPETLRDAMTAVNRVVEIVSAMRSMVYPTENKFAPVDVNGLVRDAAIISRSHWKCVAELEMDLDGDLPMPNGIAAEISQVLLNLVVNAADAVAENQEDRPAPGKICVKTWADKSSVLVEVADNGAGVPQAIRERIFEPFFTTKEVGKGTGQGLAFSYQAVQRHHGAIELDSAPGQGTRFLVRLPLDPTSAGDANLTPEKAAACVG